MNYLLKSNRSRRRNPLPAIVVLLCVGVIILVQFLSPQFFPRIFHTIGSPLWSSKNFVSVRIHRMTSFLASRNSLVDANRSLREELNKAHTKLLALNIFAEENTELKKMMGRETNEAGILAVVLVRPPQSLYDTFILDVGESEGVRVGDEIIAGDNVLIGEVLEVYPETSKAKLFSTVNEESQAIVSRNNVSVTTIGKGGCNFEIHVPQEFDIVKGDIIVAPSIFPRILGEVMEIETNAADSFKRVLLKNPINIAEIEWVKVVHNNG